ncbi:4'-phosphopantetheinyl transferase superfamily protein [Streptomyces sp. NPDC047981]|uniref:4'-phosphopantetheinyl transferase family protein n=1 Tax=Streptomyces sp. NPDC047981 TaxID=3154610 RepID=UPI0034177029
MKIVPRLLPHSPELEPPTPPALPVPGDAPHVWLVRAPEVDLPAARTDVLDAGERETARGFRSDADRRTYAEVHVGLRVLLGGYLGMKPQDVPLVRRPCPECREPHGRPAVEGDPLHFSLSHSDGLGLLAFAASPVGVDVERLPGPDTVEEVAPMLHPREAAELAALPTAERPRAFARTWARKEAYLKGLGTGLARGLALDHIGAAEPCEARLPGWRIGDVTVDPTHAGAVAVRI